MQRQIGRGDGKWALSADGLAEALWETMIALAMAAAICIGVVSLAAHLKESRNVIESAGAAAGRQAAVNTQSDVAGLPASTRLE